MNILPKWIIGLDLSALQPGTGGARPNAGAVDSTPDGERTPERSAAAINTSEERIFNPPGVVPPMVWTSTPPTPVARVGKTVQGSEARALRDACARADLRAIKAFLEDRTATQLQALTHKYRVEVGRDLEYDLRGFSLHTIFDPHIVVHQDPPRIQLRGGLRGAELAQALDLLHGPAAAEAAAKIGALRAALRDGSAVSDEALGDVYEILAKAGGEQRSRIDRALMNTSQERLVDATKAIFELAKQRNDARAYGGPPDKTVAVVVGSGNWKRLLEGDADIHIGGYHWREIEAYVREAISRGYRVEFFTPDGLPASPDALSLLQGGLEPKFGFGLRKGTGPTSMQGHCILEGLRHPRSMACFDASRVAALHIAGGHGSHHDIVGHPDVERAARETNAANKPITAVCHATPALGRDLLAGRPATGFSPALDLLTSAAGYVLPEFLPPYDAHEGLRKRGAEVRSLLALDINHTEHFEAGGAPVMTGTGPEATDDVARWVFGVLDEGRRS